MLWVLLAGFIFLASVKGVEKAVQVTISKQDFLARITREGKAVSEESGIPLSLIVTQAAHESNYGRSGLAQKSNNLFGIKAGSTWKGAVDLWPTYEVINGKTVKVQAEFRKYNSWTDSLRDWYKFLQKDRYKEALAYARLGDGPKFFAALQKAGYATDPAYSAKLVNVFNSIKEAVA